MSQSQRIKETQDEKLAVQELSKIYGLTESELMNKLISDGIWAEADRLAPNYPSLKRFVEKN